MTTAKLFIFSIFFALLFVMIASQKSSLEPEDTISSLRIELEQLKTKVSILESTFEKSDSKLNKDDGIKQMENIIPEKSQSATLRNKIVALQQKGSLDAYQELEGSNSHVAEAEKLLQKVNNVRIQMTEEALQVTEEEMMKEESEATFMKSLKSLIADHWNYSWRPALDALFPKVRQVGEMCIEMLKKEGVPVMKDQWLSFISSLGSHFKPLTAKIIEAYHVTKNSLLSNTANIQTTFSPFIQELPVMKDQWLTFISSLSSCLESLTAKIMEACRLTKNSLLSYTVKIQTATAPFIQEVYKFAKPYINQFETVRKPYTDMDVVILQPHSGKPARACRMLVTSIISYHNQVQQWLKTNELTRPLASIGLPPLLYCACLLYACVDFIQLFLGKK
ncbi:uncharacterized protein LOC129320923 isoform X2 [Prosopis cineraria]|uniref:uncharacterized protein LOC129320923 isoform X2 n=1 Tax=Prosopis cineraria TaxID=364024 RepID=UPI00241018AB|nr:uncharacterized protein LOC129320923 isoform X2 [Prosopis cineraria]